MQPRLAKKNPVPAFLKAAVDRSRPRDHLLPWSLARQGLGAQWGPVTPALNDWLIGIQPDLLFRQGTAAGYRGHVRCFKRDPQCVMNICICNI